MQMNDTGRGVRLAIEIGVSVANGLLFVAGYVARANHLSSGFARTNFGFLAEVGFLIGILALMLVVVVRWKFNNLLVRWMLLVTITFWNQACLTAFLASLIPFRLQ